MRYVPNVLVYVSTELYNMYKGPVGIGKNRFVFVFVFVFVLC